MEPREIVYNLDSIVQLLIRKFYSKGKQRQSERESREDLANVGKIFQIIKTGAVSQLSGRDIGKLTNLAEAASYFDVRDPSFWDLIEEKSQVLLSKQDNVKMNLIQVSQLLRAMAYTISF